MTKLILPSELEQQIRRHCEAAYPHEACGLLIGSGQKVTAVVASANLSDSPENSFEIDPALIIKYQKKARAGGGQLIGHYHSHPDGKAEPSDRDQQQTYDPDLIWLIVEVRGGQSGEIKGFGCFGTENQLTAIPSQ